MNRIKTKDGTSIFYKDWGTGPTIVCLVPRLVCSFQRAFTKAVVRLPLFARIRTEPARFLGRNTKEVRNANEINLSSPGDRYGFAYHNP